MRWIRGADGKLLSAQARRDLISSGNGVSNRLLMFDHRLAILSDQIIRRSVQRGSPFGGESRSEKAVRRLGLESTLRRQGRLKQ